MGYVRHTFDSPTPNEEHELAVEVKDVEGLDDYLKDDRTATKDAEALVVFLQQ